MTKKQGKAIKLPQLPKEPTNGFLAKQMDHLARAMHGYAADNEKRFQSIEDKMDKRSKEVDKRFDAVDKRFDGIDGRLDGIDTRIDNLEERMESGFEEVDKRFDEVDNKMDDRPTYEYIDKKLKLHKQDILLRLNG